MTAVGQSRQIDRPTTLVSCPLRADRVRNSAPQRIEALCPDPDSEHHSESPVSRNPIKASMRQSPQVSGSAPLTGLSTLVTISNRFEQPIDGHYNTARRAGSTVEPGSHWISTRRNPLAWIARAPVLAI